MAKSTPPTCAGCCSGWSATGKCGQKNQEGVWSILKKGQGRAVIPLSPAEVFPDGQPFLPVAVSAICVFFLPYGAGKYIILPVRNNAGQE